VVRDPAKHPKTCRLCGAEIEPSRKGQARLYCPADVRPCKERFRVLKELGERVEAWEADGRPKVADQIRAHIASLRSSWGLAAK